MNAEPPDFEWVIAARADIQSRLHDLFRLHDRHRESLLADKSLARAYSTLAGAGFSLWRAAFLTNFDRGWNEALTAATDILAEVLTTNAIGFPFEHKRRGWTFGYYLNNAVYRLAAARKVLRIEDRAVAQFDELLSTGLFLIDYEPPEQWRIAYDVLRDAQAVLSERATANR